MRASGNGGTKRILGKEIGQEKNFPKVRGKKSKFHETNKKNEKNGPTESRR